MPTLHTDRLLLSTPVMGDVDAVTAICQDEQIQYWTTVPSPYLREHAEEFIGETVERGREEGSHTWALREGDGTGLLGFVSLTRRPGPDHAEVGFWLAPDARGGGLMTEAVRRVCDFGFARDGLGLQRIVWHAMAGNLGSAAVARRAGFRFEGLRRLGGVQRGVRQDDWSAALLADDDPDAPVVAASWPPEAFPLPA